jgi:hypothetical protein
MMRLICIALLCLLPGAAWADPITATVFLATYIGGTAAAAVVSFVISYGTTLAFVAATAYGTTRARSKARKAQASARAAYNASLQDRSVTLLSIAPPRRLVLGRCETGGAVVAMFTTDKALPGGGTKPDALKHLVIVWASHQCQAIHDIKIDGVSIGALDGNASSTDPEWASPDQQLPERASASGAVRSMALSGVIGVLAVMLERVDSSEAGTGYQFAVPQGGANGWSISGTTLTLPDQVLMRTDSDGNAQTLTASAEASWVVEYMVSAATAAAGLGNVVSAGSSVRVVHHLGDPNQAVDATLNALIPTQWTAEHRLRGLCYSVVTLDLERTQFQGGPPGVTADLSGALILDRRTGTTAWSDNPALCLDHWLRSELGYSAQLADIDAASVIAAANACAATASFTTGGVTTTGPRYTCNGPISADQAKEAVLQDLCESMAGWASYGGAWRMQAGTWVPPVMSLGDDDLAGPITIIQAGEPSSELFNSVRGQYVPAGSSVPAEVEPYQNATFVAADGRPLWRDVDMPFTDSKARAKNLSRIQTEQARNGLVIHYPAKLKAWPLQTGDRVSITSAEYGFAAKVFRVTDWAFGLNAPVGLTLQEDGADAYDDADAAVADPTPNTQLPNPWVVPALAGLTLTSGTAELQRLGDGTILSRVLAIWPRSTAAYMDSGRIELSWRELGSATWTVVNAAGDDTKTYLPGVIDGRVIIVSAVVVNSNSARSPAVVRARLVLGKSVPPAAVAGLTAFVVPGAVRIAWTPCAEPDYAETVLRVGASWAAGTPLPRVGPASSYDWLWPALGNYTIWARHVDTTGNASSSVSVAVSVTSAAINVPGSSVVAPPEWLISNVPLGKNLVLNSAFESGMYGWNPTAAPYPISPYEQGINYSPDWRLAPASSPNTSVFWSRQLGGGGAGGFYEYYSSAMPVEGGATYCLSAYTGAHRCRVSIYCRVFNSGGALIQNGRLMSFNDAEAMGGPTLAGYKRQFAIGSLLANAAYVELALRKEGTYAGEGDSYVFATRFQLEKAKPGATEPTEWGDSGLIATWPGVAGPGRPEDYATQNDVIYSSTAPSSPTSRTIWIDTSVTPRTLRMWLGGTWVLAGTYVNGTAQLTDDAQLGLTALWEGILPGTGKPESYATRNLVFYQDSDPGDQPERTVWITSTKAWQRVGGAWRPYVGAGSVGTSELAAEAATQIAQVENTGLNVSYQPGDLGVFNVAQVTFTANQTCKAIFTLVAPYQITVPKNNWSLESLVDISPNSGGAWRKEVALITPGVLSGVVSRSFYGFNLTAGQVYTVTFGLRFSAGTGVNYDPAATIAIANVQGLVEMIAR